MESSASPKWVKLINFPLADLDSARCRRACCHPSISLLISQLPGDEIDVLVCNQQDEGAYVVGVGSRSCSSFSPDLVIDTGNHAPGGQGRAVRAGADCRWS